MKKILFFAPYGFWTIHHQVDAVLGAALMHRGHDIRIVICDGVFEYCPLSKGETNKQFCQACRNSALKLFSTFKLPLVHLSKYLSKLDQVECQAWAKNLYIDEIPDAIFEKSQLGKWVAAGVHSFFLSGELDLSNQHIANVYRNFLYNGALLNRAYTRILKNYQPNHVVCFQAILSYYRVAFELSRLFKIPVLTHEKGSIGESFIFRGLNGFHEIYEQVNSWDKWKNIPLTTEECLKVHQYFFDRERGVNSNQTTFYDSISDHNSVRRVLRIPSEARIIVLFTSSDWEQGMGKTFVKRLFNSQIEGVKKIIEIFKNRKEYLVIRHHPNNVGDSYTDFNFIQQLFQLNRSIDKNQKNIRIVMPNEQLTSYAIIWHADAAITFGSTMGLESGLRGALSCAYSNNVYSQMGIGIQLVKKVDDCEHAIDDAVKRTESFNLENLRTIYRAAFHTFIRFSFIFKSFRIVTDSRKSNQPDIRIKNVQELSEGVDKSLDHLYNHIIHKSPIFFEPNDDEKNRKSTQETEFIDKIFLEIRNKRKTIREYSEKYNQFNDLLLSIIYVKKDNEPDSKNNVFFQTIEKSRHLNIELLDINCSYYESSILFSKLLSVINNVRGKYIYIGMSNIHVDESLFSTAIDFLQESNNYDSIVSGAWICDDNKKINNELFTKRKNPNSFIQATVLFPSLVNPLNLMSFFLWKKKSFEKFLLAMKNYAANSDMTSFIFEKLFSNNSSFRMYKTLIPAITIYPFKTNQLQKEKNNNIEITHHSSPYKFEDIYMYIDSVNGHLVPGQEKYLFEKVTALPAKANILEIGCNQGRSTTSMAFACVGTEKKVFSIDTFMGMSQGGTNLIGESFFDVWNHNMNRLKLQNYVKPLIGFSHAILQQLAHKNIKFDFVFIDASHHYKDIVKDFELVFPLVNDDGWISLHDVSPAWPGPWRVWNESAMPSLSFHNYCSTIACGQKVHYKKLVKSDPEKFFNYSYVWMKYLENSNQHISDAMKTLLLANDNDDSMNARFEKADSTIATMPDHLKFHLREMLRLEASIDPFLHYYNALTYIGEIKYIDALKIFTKIKQDSHLNIIVWQRIKMHIEKLKRILSNK